LRTSDGFDLDAYKLMKESRYDLTNHHLQGMSLTKILMSVMTRKKWYRNRVTEFWHQGLALATCHSSRWKFEDAVKNKQSFTQYVMAEEAGNDKGDNAMFSPKSLVFDRLQPSTPWQRPYVFSKMGKDKTAKPSVFRRLKGGKQPKPSIFIKIKTGGKSSSTSPA